MSPHESTDHYALIHTHTHSTTQIQCREKTPFMLIFRGIYIRLQRAFQSLTCHFAFSTCSVRCSVLFGFDVYIFFARILLCVLLDSSVRWATLIPSQLSVQSSTLSVHKNGFMVPFGERVDSRCYFEGIPKDKSASHRTYLKILTSAECTQSILFVVQKLTYDLRSDRTDPKGLVFLSVIFNNFFIHHQSTY